jgi:hypothetical protein
VRTVLQIIESPEELRQGDGAAGDALGPVIDDSEYAPEP